MVIMGMISFIRMVGFSGLVHLFVIIRLMMFFVIVRVMLIVVMRTFFVIIVVISALIAVAIFRLSAVVIRKIRYCCRLPATIQLRRSSAAQFLQLFFLLVFQIRA